MKIKLTPEQYNRWIWHREVYKIKEKYKFDSLSVEDLEEVFICVINGMTNKQLKYFYDINPFLATKMRNVVRETKLWQTYNRVFQKNNMLFSPNGIYGGNKFGRRKIN
jgi:hypothetical protein